MAGPGQFAARGGIIDVFPRPRSDRSRLEMFGDEVESIRGFDRLPGSITRREEVTLTPAREFPLRAADIPAVLERVRALDLSACLPEVRESWTEDLARLAEAGYFPGVESLYPYLVDRLASILDYFPEPPAGLVLEPARLRQQAERQARDVEELLADEAAHGELPRGLSSGLLPYLELEGRTVPALEVERVADEGAIEPPGMPQ